MVSSERITKDHSLNNKKKKKKKHTLVGLHEGMFSLHVILRVPFLRGDGRGEGQEKEERGEEGSLHLHRDQQRVTSHAEPPSPPGNTNHFGIGFWGLWGLQGEGFQGGLSISGWVLLGEGGSTVLCGVIIARDVFPRINEGMGWECSVSNILLLFFLLYVFFY